MLLATVGGLQFDEWPRSFEESMFLIGPGGLKGWFTGTPGRQNGGDRPSAHGQFDVPVYRAGRSISIEGTILATSRATLENAKNLLTGLLGEGQSGRLTVQTENGATYADVRQTGVTPGAVDGLEAEFLLQFVAADPRRYGETQQFTSGRVYHYGTAVGIPEVIVTGNLPSGYRINGPGGRQYVVGQGLSSGQTHRIDMRTGWLYRNDVLQKGVGVVTRYQTWGIPPGEEVAMSLTPVSGTGSMTVKVPDTYL